MNLPLILVIDDEFGRITRYKRRFCSKTSTIDITELDNDMAHVEETNDAIAMVKFSSGQTEGLNNLDQVIQFVSDNLHADLILLDSDFEDPSQVDRGKAYGEKIIRPKLKEKFGKNLPLMIYFSSKHQKSIVDEDKSRFFSKEFLNGEPIAASQKLKSYLELSTPVTLDVALKRLEIPDSYVVEDPKTLSVYKEVYKSRNSDCNIHISGETGVGKEFLAKYAYKISNRKEQPFVHDDMGAIPVGDDFAIIRLFGCAPKAHQGAGKGQDGLFTLANGGTLFLDEIGLLDPLTQNKLSRAIQFGEFTKFGSNKIEKVDVRIISAHSEPLDRLVVSGKFRKDLYYRLNELEVHIPSLSERSEDIKGIAIKRLEFITKQNGKVGVEFSSGALIWLKSQQWPGNARQLVSFIEPVIESKDHMEEISEKELHEKNKFIQPSDHTLENKINDIPQQNFHVKESNTTLYSIIKMISNYCPSGDDWHGMSGEFESVCTEMQAKIIQKSYEQVGQQYNKAAYIYIYGLPIDTKKMNNSTMKGELRKWLKTGKTHSLPKCWVGNEEMEKLYESLMKK